MFGNTSLPFEIQLKILSELTAEELAKTALVNKKSASFSNDASLWKRLLSIHFPDYFEECLNIQEQLLENEISYKEVFIQAYQRKFAGFSNQEKYIFSLLRQGCYERFRSEVDKLNQEELKVLFNRKENDADYNLYVCALAFADEKTITFLKDKGADIHQDNIDSIIIDAVEDGHTRLVEELIKDGANIKDVRKAIYPWESIFHIAARNGYLDMLKILFREAKEKDFDPNEIKIGHFDKTTILEFAIEHNQDAITEFLLTQEDYPIKEDDVKRAMDEIFTMEVAPSKYMLSSVIKSIKSDDDLAKNLISALSCHRLEMAREIIKTDIFNQIDFDHFKNKFGQKLIDAAFFGDKPKVIKFLVEEVFHLKTVAEIKAVYREGIRIHINIGKTGKLGDGKTDAEWQEKAFYLAMQEPVNGKIVLPKTITGNNGLLSSIGQFFTCGGDYIMEGEAPYGMSFANINLGVYRPGNYPSYVANPPPGFPYVAKFLKENPKIRMIDLSYTNLDDSCIAKLCETLETNTHITEIKYEGNPKISEENRERLEARLMRNRDMNQEIDKEKNSTEIIKYFL